MENEYFEEVNKYFQQVGIEYKMSACYWYHENSDKCIYCGWIIGNNYPMA